jgi:hypothetical protein
LALRPCIVLLTFTAAGSAWKVKKAKDRSSAYASPYPLT